MPREECSLGALSDLKCSQDRAEGDASISVPTYFLLPFDDDPAQDLELRDLIRLGDCIDRMSSVKSDSILSPAVWA